MHGTGAWSETWRESLDTLAAAGFHAAALDLPPFGHSERPARPRYSRADQARRILGVLDALGARRAILVGHSFGAGPTVEAALLAPERVRALILVDAALSIRPDGVPPRPAPAAVRTLLAVTPLRNALVATFLTNPLVHAALARRLRRRSGGRHSRVHAAAPRGRAGPGSRGRALRAQPAARAPGPRVTVSQPVSARGRARSPRARALTSLAVPAITRPMIPWAMAASRNIANAR